jgi:hypothetical protein
MGQSPQDSTMADPDPVIHDPDFQDPQTPGPAKFLSCFIYFLLIFMVIMGLAYFGHGLGILNEQLNFGMAYKVWEYGQTLKSQGWEIEYPVDTEEFVPPSGDGSLIWFAVRKEPDDPDWVNYIWEYYQSSSASRAILRERGISDALWWFPSRSFLIPRTQAALDAHLEIGLPLPGDFEVEELDENILNELSKSDSQGNQ